MRHETITRPQTLTTILLGSILGVMLYAVAIAVVYAVVTTWH